MDAITVDDLEQYIGPGSATTTQELDETLTAAKDLVEIYTKGKTVPPAILKSAVLECGSKIFQRRNAPTGEYADGTGQMILAPRDPMVTTYPILRPFIGTGL